MSVTPDDGTTKARPERGITVRASGGKLQSVTVQGRGRRIEGTLSADQTTWRSSWTLQPATKYTVTATAVNPVGKPTTVSSVFSTLRPQRIVHASVSTIAPGQRVGVGMPIIVDFDQPVANRAEVERALQVQAEKSVEGAWRWVSDQQVVFRTRTYWPHDQNVQVVARLGGVRAAKDMYGVTDYRLAFRIGAAHISTVNTRTHRMIITSNGKTLRNIPISAGRATDPGTTTSSGIHLTMDKGNPVVMTSAWMGVTDPKDPNYYNLKVNWAVRISAGGEYVHSAPWSIDAQGNANVSHGCINASPTNAEWFYNFSQPGDVVIITGTDRRLEWDNGWGYWQMPWSQWVKGSALRQAVTPSPFPSTAGTTATSSPSPVAVPSAG